MVVSCSAYGCTNRQSNGTKLQFHRFPHSNSKLLIQWVRAVRRASWQPTKFSRLCSDHFTPDSYKSDARRYLKDDAVPSLFNFSAYSKKSARLQQINTELNIRRNNDIGMVSSKKCMLCNIVTKPLFGFPRNSDRCMKWLKKLGKVNLCEKYDQTYIYNNGRLCSAHFEDKYFTSTLKTRLSYGAIPTLAIPTSNASSDEVISYVSDHSKEKKDAIFVAKEKSANKNYDNEKNYLEERNKQLNVIKLEDSNSSEIKHKQVHSGLSQSDHYLCVDENESEKQIVTLSDSSFEELIESDNSNDIVSEKENTDLKSKWEQNMCILKKCFTYEKLVESISLIKRPNLWWTVSSANNFIICARWNKDYIGEKKVVIESTLTIRVFLKELEINITEFMDVTCIDDISNLLEKVENYKTLTDSNKL